MRIAVISDMHGNDFVFEKVETDIKVQGVDQIVSFGDAIQGGAQPAGVVQRLRRLNCPVVMGNADDWLFTSIEQGKADPAGQGQKDGYDPRLDDLPTHDALDFTPYVETMPDIIQIGITPLTIGLCGTWVSLG